MNQMIIEYVYHSCYTVTLKDYFLVFDYWKGNLKLPTDKQIVFVVTHRHADHFNPDIFQLRGTENAIYLLSSDLLREDEDSVITVGEGFHFWNTLKEKRNLNFLHPGDTLELGKMMIRAFPSTDLGISIYLQLYNVGFFHAGDLNCWKWETDPEEVQQKEEDDFLDILDEVANYPIDVAFFPVDPRLKDNYTCGPEAFIQEVQPQLFFPMHFGTQTQITRMFYSYMALRSSLTRVQLVFREGERTIVDMDGYSLD